SLHRERHHPFHPVDGLVITFMKMWQWNLRARRNGEFKHRQRAVRLRSFEQKAYSYLSNLDDLVFHSGYQASPFGGQTTPSNSLGNCFGSTGQKRFMSKLSPGSNSFAGAPMISQTTSVSVSLKT